jgi:predicted  nucleic acid-binding Zn-ribbon protein
LKQQLTQLENEKKQLLQDMKTIDAEREQLRNALTQQRQSFSEKEESIYKKIADEKRETTNSIQKLTKEKEVLTLNMAFSRMYMLLLFVPL